MLVQALADMHSTGRPSPPQITCEHVPLLRHRPREYSQSMQFDETRTLAALSAIREAIDNQIKHHRGRIANTAGDSVLAFGSAVEAVSCAMALQAMLFSLTSGPSSIAVLPFENLSADREQEYFADGIVEEIITALSRFRSQGTLASPTRVELWTLRRLEES